MNPELKKRDKEQAAQLKEAKKRWLKELEEEPKVECIVRNHDFLNQGVPIEFTFRRVKKYTIKDGETVYGMAFTAEEIDYLDSRAESEARRNGGQGAEGVPTARSGEQAAPVASTRKPRSARQPAHADA